MDQTHCQFATLNSCSFSLPLKDPAGKKSKEKEENNITQKAKDERKHGLLALILPWDPTLHPSKAHQNLLKKQGTLKKTHSKKLAYYCCLPTIYCAEGRWPCTAIAPPFKKLIEGWWQWQCKTASESRIGL
uniref:Uncharacterized protein n=1 Tax=Arundo donax TaxID=35708 RepID=A0A0A8ZM80_ARUDO